MNKIYYLLRKLWTLQKEYNFRIKLDEQNSDREFWTEKYLLGIVSEVDEILQDINWKRHRKTVKEIDKDNLAHELADLTKYVFSLWQLWDFTLYQAVNITLQKSIMLEEIYAQENFVIPSGSIVLITDLDGTLGDWRASFIQWAEDKHSVKMPDDPSSSLMMDTDLAMSYPMYYNLKEEFEQSGGYGTIELYEDVAKVVRELKQANPELIHIVTTARPAGRYHRIWMDTWNWLLRNDLQPHQLLMTSEPRILLASSLSNSSKIIMFDDDPGMIIRAANSGIKVFVKEQPYNKGVEHENVVILKYFDECPLDIFIK